MIARRAALCIMLTVLAMSPTQAGAPASSCRCASTLYPLSGRVKLPNGRCLAYTEYGDPAGPLVIYFHGTPGSRLEAGLIADEVAASGVRLVAVDRPGVGRSTYQSGRRILDWPCDVERLAAALGYAEAPFGILAVSGGAPYAAACARDLPHRLTHVTIVSGHAPPCAPCVCPGNQDQLIALVAKRPRLSNVVFGFLAKRLRKRPDKIVQRMTAGWSADDRRLVLCDPRLKRMLIANLKEATRCGPQGAVTDIRLLGSCWGFRLCEVQGVGVSIWQGGCDRISTPSMGRYFHEQIAGSEFTLDPDAGHVTVLKRHALEILTRYE